ncbi:BafA family autotransporter [Bartonella raoultii]|uniref:BafA family autotransporter n=1 Tax=Bartonella raoultii TaxID=1457020 RepID=A0ABS7I6V5_9HYPH|nr:BafA family autotransporter [Bartonella raoultii]MBX4336190.1 BafA family autotransporter [Bartonella raoultii]
MQKKCKLSFPILMISSSLIQAASAAESKNESLTNMSSVANGGKVPKGSALIMTILPSSNIEIENGGVEIVDNGRTSMRATVQKGGMQIVTRGGTAIDTKVFGGKQFIYEEKDLDLRSVDRKSSTYNTIVSGSGGAVGQQNVSDDAIAWSTKVGEDGEQNLYAGLRKGGGKAMQAEVSGNGRQHVLALGESLATTLKENATQVVYPEGFVDSLTITGFASSWLYAGVKKVVGEVKVNDKGRLYLFAGDVTNQITKENISVTGRADETIFLVGERNKNEKPQIEIEHLGGEGGTVIFTSTPYDPRHISLHVDELSGNLHFRFNINVMGNYNSDYLLIDNGAGNHKISVADSGAEITGPLVQKNGRTTEIPLIIDKSQNEGANFTLADLSGKNITAVDGGAYQYLLYKRERCADSSGSATIWYLGRSSGNTEHSNSPSQCTNKKQKIPMLLRDSYMSAGTDDASGRGNRKKKQPKPKERPPRHLKEAQHISNTSTSEEGQVIKPSHLADGSQRSDGHEPTVVSTEASLIAAQMVARPLRKEHSSPLQAHKEMSVSTFLTTPSTDAVLSLSVTPGLMFHNELQAVRTGRGLLDKNKKKTSLWTYAIKSKESISADHIDFKLDQTGVLLGLGILNKLAHGEFSIGSFGGYDQARIAHARGGTSRINTYSVGAYATYFDESGWYLDGILKYNHYQNTLKAVSTNGLAIEGNYDQDAIGSSFEVGYRFKMAQSGWLQPYTQLRWLQVSGKEIKLSNGMTGSIDPFTSLRSEVGLSLGYEFGCCMETSSTAYITGAWLREHKENNHTRINQHHQFMTDLSGNAGKLGVGLSSLVSDKLKLYAEAHYIKGHKMKQSFQGALGMRYRF